MHPPSLVHSTELRCFSELEKIFSQYFSALHKPKMGATIFQMSESYTIGIGKSKNNLILPTTRIHTRIHLSYMLNAL